MGNNKQVIAFNTFIKKRSYYKANREHTEKFSKSNLDLLWNGVDITRERY